MNGPAGAATSARTGTQKAIILDVDGVVSALSAHPDELPWGDETFVGTVLGPVWVSPQLCDRLDALDRIPGVSCWWLTSWTAEMRASMTTFPGRNWASIVEPVHAALAVGSSRTRWWKLVALEAWLDTHREVSSVAWCDDQIRGGRIAAAKRTLTTRGIPTPLLITPTAHRGLTPSDLECLEEWARRLPHK